MHALLPLIKNMINVSCRSIYFNTNGELTYYLIKYNVVMNISRFSAYYLFIFSLKNMILGMLILQSQNIKRSGYAIWYLCRLFFSKLRLFYYISDSKPKEQRQHLLYMPAWNHFPNKANFLFKHVKSILTYIWQLHCCMSNT